MSSVRQRFAVGAAALVATFAFASPARAAFHLWSISELYSNSSGSLQFIEFREETGGGGGQQFVSGKQVQIAGGGTFVFPSNLPGNSANKRFILGTAGIQGAGGPAPDYIIPSNFLPVGGGTITFLSSPFSPVTYPALPTDGLSSYNPATSSNDPSNSPQNFSNQIGLVNGVPEPTTMVLVPVAAGLYYGLSRRKKRAAELA